MRCSKCGHPVPPEIEVAVNNGKAAFCVHCGNALAGERSPSPVVITSVACPACGVTSPGTMKFCRHCGAAMPHDATGPVVEPASVPLAIDSTLESSAPEPAPIPTPTHCPKCQSPLAANVAFCQRCGYQLTLGALDAAPAVPPPPQLQVPMNTPIPQQAPVVLMAQAQSHGLSARSASPSWPTVDASPPVASLLPSAAAPLSAPVSAPAPLASPLAGPALAPQPPPVMLAAADAWGRLVLVNRDGSDGAITQLAAPTITVGRGPADVRFPDDRFLAPLHARLDVTPQGVVLTPIDQQNGVFRRIDGQVELNCPTFILLGREVLRVEIIDDAERRADALVQHGVACFGSPPREPWARLAQRLPSGGQREVRYVHGPEYVLGREEGDWTFRDDAFMSRRHAVLLQRPVPTIRDLGSSNGTFVRLGGPALLGHGQFLRIGDQLLRFELYATRP